MKIKIFSYNIIDTPIHQLSGLSKFICFLLMTVTVMLSYDIRVILCIMAFSFIALRVSRIKLSQIKIMLIYVLIFLVANFIISYLFAPEQGSEIYGTHHEFGRIWGRWTLTWEQLLYQGTKTLKYASVIPLGIIFLFTTDPSEFASSLSGVKVNYKAAYAVSLTLRYFPDIQREYNDISMAQQARGLDMSHKAKLTDRFKNALLIIVPLLFSTLDRIESISNAMDLRGFGKKKKRTWYARRMFKRNDRVAMFVCGSIFAISLCVSLFINHSRFYNPFVG
jgi:energy-coupling factor transport system permease protein